jgi:hypothetical protein
VAGRGRPHLCIENLSAPRRLAPSVVSASHQSSGRKTQRPQSLRTHWWFPCEATRGSTSSASASTTHTTRELTPPTCHTTAIGGAQGPSPPSPQRRLRRRLSPHEGRATTRPSGWAVAMGDSSPRRWRFLRGVLGRWPNRFIAPSTTTTCAPAASSAPPPRAARSPPRPGRARRAGARRTAQACAASYLRR